MEMFQFFFFAPAIESRSRCNGHAATLFLISLSCDLRPQQKRLRFGRWMNWLKACWLEHHRHNRSTKSNSAMSWSLTRGVPYWNMRNQSTTWEIFQCVIARTYNLLCEHERKSRAPSRERTFLDGNIKCLDIYMRIEQRERISGRSRVCLSRVHCHTDDDEWWFSRHSSRRRCSCRRRRHCCCCCSSLQVGNLMLCTFAMSLQTRWVRVTKKKERRSEIETQTAITLSGSARLCAQYAFDKQQPNDRTEREREIETDAVVHLCAI